MGRCTTPQEQQGKITSLLRTFFIAMFRLRLVSKFYAVIEPGLITEVALVVQVKAKLFPGTFRCQNSESMLVSVNITDI